tara:strand:+ start:153 stop:353 length:201 start_codon:yes stop_codon:yes gene_type:complete
MKFISEQTNFDDSKKAQIYDNNGTYVVEYYYENRLIKTVPLPDRSLRYAQDAAENFCNGILNFLSE